VAWRIVGALLVVFVVLALLGAIISALRFLLGVAIVIAIIAALVGMGSRSKS